MYLNANLWLPMSGKQSSTTQFADAFYTQIIRFEKPVISQGNSLAKVAGNKKGVLLKLPFMDLVYGKSSLANKITLTK